MATSGVLEEVQRGAFKLIQKNSRLVGFVKNTNKRGVYVEIDNGEEVFISKELSLFSLAGDKVEILVFKKNKNKYEGEVVKVINREKKYFVGVIQECSSNYFLIPDDKRVSFDIFISEKNIKKEYLEKKVLVKVDSWNCEYKNPVGKVVKVITLRN